MGVRSFARVLVAGLVMMLVAVGCTPAKPAPLRVEYWGDSIGTQAGPYFNYWLGLSGKAVGRTHTFPGTALCDWFKDINTEISSPTGWHPQAVVIEFTGVAVTPCMRVGGRATGTPLSGQAVIDKYRYDAQRVIALFEKARVPVYFVSPPITYAQSLQKPPVTGLNPMGKMFSQLPAASKSGLVRFVDAGAAVLANGRFTWTLPCLPWECAPGKTVVVREADGVHFCPVKEVDVGGGWTTCPVSMPGAMRYATAITARVLSDFHLS